MNAKDKLLHKLNAKHSHSEGHVSTHSGKSQINKKVILLAIAVLVILGAAALLLFNPMNTKPVIQTNTTAQLSNESKALVFVIKDSACTKCFKIDDLVTQAFSDLQVKTLETTSPEGKELISKYSLTKVPVVVIQNPDKLDPGVAAALQSVAFKQQDAMVLYSPAPPYLELATGQLKGEISLTVIEADNCKDCNNFTGLKDQLTTQGILITNYTQLKHTDVQAKNLMQKYNVNFAPFIIFSSGLGDYLQIAKAWTSIGIIASDGNYVQTIPNPPFLNLTTGSVEGLVTLTYLNDSTCATCYDVKVHKNALAQAPLGLRIVNETTIDISSAQGKALIAKYNITQVPTVIISKEASLYKTFTQVWPQVGIQAQDGNYLIVDLTKLSAITYKDLKTGKVTTTPMPTTQ